MILEKNRQPNQLQNNSKCTNFKYSCPDCEYQTNRLWSIQYHLNRKTPCNLKSKNDDGVNIVNIGVNKNDDGVNKNDDGVNISSTFSQSVNISVNKNTNNASSNDKKYTCSKCNKQFSSRQSKHVHQKNCSKNQIQNTMILRNKNMEMQEMIYKLKNEVDQLKSLGLNPTTVHNNTTIINTDNSTTSNTEINNIIFNNYDEPNLEHIDAQVIKKLYFDNGRHLKKMVNEAVRKIYKKPENNTFRFPHGVKSNFVEVRYRDEKRLLPMKEVIETVLTKTSLVCEEHLRDHYYGGTIVGSAVLTHANDLEDLALQPWDDDKANRADFHPYVKSAILECI